MIRRQLPAYSPLALGDLIAGARTMLRPDGAAERLSALLARQFSASRVVLCGSGTQALQLAIAHACGQTGRPRVALPAYTCFDVASAAGGSGGGIILYDVDAATLAPDSASFAAALADRPGAIVVSPLYGLPVDWQPLAAAAAAAGALLIEDAAQGHGAYWGGQPLGSLGDLSVLSFGRGKGWTGGGGGALLFRGTAASCRLPAPPPEPGAAGDARVVAAALAQWALGRPSLYGVPSALPWLRLGETDYHPPVSPAGIPAAAAATLLRNRQAAWSEAAARRANAAWYRERVAGAPGVLAFQPPAGAEPGYLRFPVRTAGGLAALPGADGLRRLGAARGYPAPLSELPAVRDRLCGAGAPYPGAELLVRDLWTLPCHSRLSAADRNRLFGLIGASPDSVL